MKGIKKTIPDKKKKKGHTVDFSPEDRFMIESVQPATESKLCSIKYSLCVKLSYSGCVCCVNLPDTSTNFTIVPIVNPACFGFQAPNGWAPIELGNFVLDAEFHKD